MVLLKHLTDKDFRVVKQLASQIAGRKPKKGHYDFKVAPEHRRRGRQTAWKDIAQSDLPTIKRWIADDKHHAVEGGSLSNALRHTYRVLHETYKRDLQAGGSIAFLDRMGSTLSNLGKAAVAHVDIASDAFLHAVGITKDRKYSATPTSSDAMHARLHKDAYLGVDDRKGSDNWDYVRKHSTDERAVYEKDGHAKVVWRGTKPDEIFQNKDGLNDLMIAAGESSEMYGLYEDKQKMKELLDEYGDHKVTGSGYSLGGGRAMEVLSSDDIYHRLGQDNTMLAPGITALHPELQDRASRQKFTHVYSNVDGVANSLLAHSGDNHRVLTNYVDPLGAHMFLDDLAKSHPAPEPQGGTKVI
jgi:hypothetical protein